MKQILKFAGALCLLLAPTFSASTTYAQDEFIVGETTLTSSVLIDDARIPWELVWGGDDMLWCSERKGRVLRIDPSTGEYETVLDLNVTFNGSGEPGLLGMVQHPDFPDDPRVWLAYCDGQSNISEYLSVFEWNGTELVNEQELLSLPGAQIHNGARLLILPDNTILMTTGDAGNSANSQNLESLNGKILRINMDGSIPADNPFPDSYVYTWGNRNAQGLCMSPDGIVYASEHGQSNDDEFNIVEAGRNYGWPDVEGMCNTPDEADFCMEWDVREPIRTWSPCIAVNGVEFYTHEAIPAWQGKVLMAVLGGLSAQYERMSALSLSEDGMTCTGEDQFFSSFNQRIRDIAVNPYTGAIYLAFNGTSYPGAPPNDIMEFRNLAYQSVGDLDAVSIEVYPNPATDQAWISVHAGAVNADWSLIDAAGRVVRNGKLSGRRGALAIDGLDAGAYIVRCAGTTHRLVIQ
jgi:glucose/arabinose dehydrogenase